MAVTSSTCNERMTLPVAVFPEDGLFSSLPPSCAWGEGSHTEESAEFRGIEVVGSRSYCHLVLDRNRCCEAGPKGKGMVRLGALINTCRFYLIVFLCVMGAGIFSEEKCRYGLL